MEGNYQSSNELIRVNRFSFDEEHTFGSSTLWPGRNYACSFCKREFRSAQAMGGHMNVHRRDRARMRSGLPYISEYPKPNPISEHPKPKANPNRNPIFLISSSSLATASSSDDYSLPHKRHSPIFSPSLNLSSSPSSASTSEDKRSSIVPSSQFPLLSITPHQSGETKMNKTKRSTFGFEELKGFGEQDQHKGFNDNEKLDLELRL